MRVVRLYFCASFVHMCVKNNLHSKHTFHTFTTFYCVTSVDQYMSNCTSSHSPTQVCLGRVYSTFHANVTTTSSVRGLFVSLCLVGCFWYAVRVVGRVFFPSLFFFGGRGALVLFSHNECKYTRRVPLKSKKHIHDI